MEQNMAASFIPNKIRDEKIKLFPMCAACGATEDLECNHINPNLPATIDNLIVLCHSCHMNKWHDIYVRPHNHNELQRNGIKEAQKRGVHFGRPCADYDNIMRLIAKHSTQFNDVFNPEYTVYTETEIMDMAGVKPVCYAKCKNMLKEAMDAPEWQYSWDEPTVQKKMPLYDRFIKRIRDDNNKLDIPHLTKADKKRIVGDIESGASNPTNSFDSLLPLFYMSNINRKQGGLNG